jgi:hypothetical protein
MNSKHLILLLLVLCITVVFSSICFGKDNKTSLRIKKIVFTSDKDGGERLTLLCNQSCVGELSALEESKPRVVMDMKGVVKIQAKARNLNTKGKLVKKVRSYLNKRTKILRVVLDMDPSKYYIVRPMQDPSGNRFMLVIHEKPVRSGGGAEGLPGNRIN